MLIASTCFFISRIHLPAVRSGGLCLQRATEVLFYNQIGLNIDACSGF